MNNLKGKIINAIYISQDNYSIYFDTNEWILAYETVSDCCSETFISNIQTNISSNIRFCLWGKVDEVITMEDNDECWTTTQIRDIVYWYELHITPKEDDTYYKYNPADNILFITYRNSSNWYYGWWMDKLDIDTIPNDAINIIKPFESYKI